METIPGCSVGGARWRPTRPPPTSKDVVRGIGRATQVSWQDQLNKQFKLKIVKKKCFTSSVLGRLKAFLWVGRNLCWPRTSPWFSSTSSRSTFDHFVLSSFSSCVWLTSNSLGFVSVSLALIFVTPSSSSCFALAHSGFQSSQVLSIDLTFVGSTSLRFCPNPFVLCDSVGTLIALPST